MKKACEGLEIFKMKLVYFRGDLGDSLPQLEVLVSSETGQRVEIVQMLDALRMGDEVDICLPSANEKARFDGFVKAVSLIIQLDAAIAQAFDDRTKDLAEAREALFGAIENSSAWDSLKTPGVFLDVAHAATHG
jgi:hypothetical protein